MAQDQRPPTPPDTGRTAHWSQYLSAKQAAELRRAIQLQELTEHASETLLSRIAPWFFEFGSWIFSGLIAYSIVLLQAPIVNSAVARGNRALVLCTLMLAIALPLAVLGLFVLRLFGDLGRFDLEHEMEEAYKEVVEATDPAYQAPGQAALELWRKKRMRRIFNLSVSILVAVAVLTIGATAAAIWYVVWWLGVVFLAMIGVTGLFLLLISRLLRPPLTPRLPVAKESTQS